jgi:hypothetical protein
MGMIPNTVISSSSSSNINGTNSNIGHGVDVQHVQPLFPGSSVLAAFDAGNPHLAYGQQYPHPNSHPQQQQQQQQPVKPKSIPIASTSSSGITVQSPVLARRKGSSSGGGSTTGSSKTATGKANSNSTKNNNSSNSSATTGDPSGNTNRRQSRLQRNRESARLSRKRRKQYLEHLEERVDMLSETLDRSRRKHVAEAVTVLHQKRVEYILQHPHQHLQHDNDNNNYCHDDFNGADTTAIRLLENNLSRTNEELMIATTFQYQQLKSFSIPPSTHYG